MASHSDTEKTLYPETWNDIRWDSEEVSYLLRDCLARLEKFLSDIRKVRQHIHVHTYHDLYKEAGRLIFAYRVRYRSISRVRLLLSGGTATLQRINRVRTVLENNREFIRTNQTRIGALITCTDWQSPSYLHTKISQAGRETGTIYPTINDYKRDQHWDAHRFEQAFLKNNIDALIKFPIHVLACSSGMAAFTTILNFLLLEHPSTRPVLVGKSSWFQNRLLLVPAYGKKIIWFDEADTDAIRKAFDAYRPSVIFIDSLTNSPEIAVPDMSVIIKHLAKNAKKDTYLVIDNTGLSVALQPFKMLPGIHSKLRIIGFESLNKYHQSGMDRVTGGIIYSYGKDSAKLFDYRVHTGTNIPDVLAASLPTPNRKILAGRLKRHERNARIISDAFGKWISLHPASPVTGISYPGPLPCAGSYFTVKFRMTYSTVAVYKRFIALVMKTAKRNALDMVAGSSFGLNHTRVYLTAVRSKPATPFIRISAGTEDRLAIEAVKNMFLRVLKDFPG